MAQTNPYPLRVDKILMEKLKKKTSNSGRSVNKEIEFLMKQAVLQYEKENGAIDISSLEE